MLNCQQCCVIMKDEENLQKATEATEGHPSPTSDGALGTTSPTFDGTLRATGLTSEN